MTIFLSKVINPKLYHLRGFYSITLFWKGKSEASIGFVESHGPNAFIKNNIIFKNTEICTRLPHGKTNDISVQ